MEIHSYIMAHSELDFDAPWDSPHTQSTIPPYRTLKELWFG